MIFEQSDGDGITMTVTGVRTATVSTPGNSPLRVAFQAPYLLDLLSGTTSNSLGATDHLKPAVLREPTPEYGPGSHRVRLIMPVRMA